MSKTVSQKRKKDFVRYVPAIAGSPGWMSREEAERELANEVRVIETMIEAGIPQTKFPYIEEPKTPAKRRRS